VNDNARGMALAVNHLFKLGHRRIAHVSAPLSVYTGQARYRAFVNRLEQLNIKHGERLVAMTSDFSTLEGHRACKELLNRSRYFSAIVVANDSIALGCLNALTEAELECPKDIFLTGHNNILMVDRVAPALTAVAVPLIQMGRMAAQMIVDNIENPSQPPQTTFLKPEFIVRQSTGPVSRL
jgi:LacI family transcriptional regulator